MSELSIATPGLQFGTADYAAQYLAGCKLSVENAPVGFPSTSYVAVVSRRDDDKPAMQPEVVCFYAPNFANDSKSRWQDHGSDVYAQYPAEHTSTMMSRQNFFGALTPAAEKLVDDFIDQCVAALKKAVAADKASAKITVTLD